MEKKVFRTIKKIYIPSKKEEKEEKKIKQYSVVIQLEPYKP